MIVLNLFIAVILEGFEKSNQEEDSALTSQMVIDFNEAWNSLDSEARGYIRLSQIFKLFALIQEPLGYKNSSAISSFRDQRLFVARLHIPIFKIFTHDPTTEQIDPTQAKQPVFLYVDVLERIIRNLLIVDKEKTM